MGRSVRRRSAPLSPTKSRETTTSPHQTRQSSRISSREPRNVHRAQHDQYQGILEPVVEDADTILVVPSKPVLDAGSEHLSDVDKDSVASDIALSDSTADSDVSDDLEREPILESLEEIGEDVSKLMKHFHSAAVDQVISEAQDVTTDRSRAINRFARKLDIDLEVCGREHRKFLQVERLLRVLDDHTSVLEAREILTRANLAIFVSKIVDAGVYAPESEARSLLQYLGYSLSKLFPHSFVTIDEGKNFWSDTIRLGVSILTQCFIIIAESARDASDIDPEEILDALFDDSEDGSNGFPLLQNVRLNRVKEKRLSEIRRYVTGSERVHIDLPGLRKKYEWRSFVAMAVRWAVARDEQLARRIAERGVADPNIRIREGSEEISVMAVQDNEDQRKGKSKEDIALEVSSAYNREVDRRLEDTEEESVYEPETQRLSPGHTINTQGPHPASVERYRLAAQTLLNSPGKQFQHRSAISESPQPQLGDQDDMVFSVKDDNEIDLPDATSEHSVEPESLVQSTRAVSVPRPESQARNEVPRVVAPQKNAADWIDNPSPEVREVLAEKHRQEQIGQKGKELGAQKPGFLHRQLDAVRERFDQDTQAQNHNKKHPVVEDDESDAGYESDSRPAKRPRSATSKVPAARAPSPAQRDSPGYAGMVSPSPEPEVQQSRKPGASDKPSGRQHHHREPQGQPGPSSAPQIQHTGRTASSAHFQDDAIPSTAPPTSSFPNFNEISSTARENMQDIRRIQEADTGMRIQTRKATVRWTDAENGRLMELMANFSCQWATIMAADADMPTPMLQGRNQVALKDRARNMLMTMLRAEELPPPFMLGVTLKKAEVQKLMAEKIPVPDRYRLKN
ncbi:hypothetical protein LTS08_006721 [Lithohypha guttulata]|nr:hypothetical protein LTS08_006721 [Lithohypha guttulata]